MEGNDTLDPHEADRERRLDWIEACWNQLAAYAWQRYVREGRGIVLVNGDFEGEVVVGYQTPQTAVEAGSAWPDDLVAAVQGYTPATDIVLLVRQPGTSGGMLLGMRTTSPRLPPAKAGQQDGSAPLVHSA